MFCIHCGSKLIDGANFCTSCGQKISIYTNVNEKVEEEDIKEIEEQHELYEEDIHKSDDDELSRELREKLLDLLGRFGRKDLQNNLLQVLVEDDVEEQELLVTNILEEVDNEEFELNLLYLLDEYEVMNIFGEEDDETEEERAERVCKVFKKYFNRSNFNDYGRKIYIFGIEMMPESTTRNLKREFNYEDDETILLAFNYKNLFEQGFLLTDKYFRWKDSFVGFQSWDLERIYDLNKEKRMLADIIYFISKDNNVSKDVHLIGIDNVHEFVFQLQLFIKEINGYDNDIEKTNTGALQSRQTLIAEACKTAKIDSSMCIIGLPYIDASYSKYEKAKKYFNIPDSENIFLILDSSLFGSCKSGLAVCYSGIYYCLSKNTGIISWGDFKDVEIKKGMSAVRIGEKNFACNVGSEQNGVCAILKNLQSLIKLNPNAFK